jgi:hypothetical protein
MAQQKYYIGSMGPYLFDDTINLLDPDNDFPGETQSGFITSGPIKTLHTGTTDDDLVRRADIAAFVAGEFDDNEKFYFGTGNDVSLYYDGTDFNIKTNEVAASDLKLDCGTEKTLLLLQVVYEDLQVGISNIKLPASNEPADRLYACGVGGGVTFPFLGFAIGEYIYFDVQTSHSMKLNTILDNHIHFVLPDTTTIGDKFKFQLDVIAAGINGQWAVPAGSPFSGEHTVAANDNTYHRLLSIADIPAVNTTLSTIYKCKLTRIAASSSDYAGEVYLTFTDCHYQKDTMGSRQENSK